MAEWKISGLQIIVSVISSGLIVTVFGILINNIVKPDLQFDVEVIDRETINPCGSAYRETLGSNECWVYDRPNIAICPVNTECNNYSILENTVENQGMGTANNLRLTLYYPNADVRYYYTKYSTENITSVEIENSHLLSVNIPRFTQGGKIVVTTLIKGDTITDDNLKEKYHTPREHDFIDRLYGGDSNILMATYDQASKSYSPEDDPLFGKNFIPYKIPILLIALIVTIISVPIALRHKTIKSSKDSKKPAGFVYDIYENIAEVRDILNKCPQSTKIFTPAIWDSKGYEGTRQIFDTYDEYKRLDQFYEELRIRNSYFSHYYLVTNNKIDILEEHNVKCRDLANDAYTNIKWERFFDSKSKRKLDLILSIPLILLTSILLFFVCEGAIVNIFASYPILQEIFPFPASLLLLFLISFSARGIAISLIIREILKRFEAFDADYSGINNSISMYSTIPKRNKIKLFVYSAIIMSVPVAVFLFPVYYVSSGFANYLTYNTYTSAMLFIVDIARLAILIYVVIPKYITNGQKIDTIVNHKERLKV